MAISEPPPDHSRPPGPALPVPGAWHTRQPDAVVAELTSDRQAGLTAGQADARLQRHGPNEIASEPESSTWSIGLHQLKDLMNLMLVAVVVVSIVIDEVPTATVVAVLVVINVVLGTRQELKACASVDALARMQIPQARVIRDGTLLELDATDLVPGDIVVTETGIRTEMGRIASMLSAVAPSMSPLQRELNSLTKLLGIIAWSAVAVIVVLGVLRGQSPTTVLLLGISMGVSAIPTGLPTFMQAMLAFGARQLAEAKAVVKNRTDVETLGATSAINSDKTGTLTMNQMTVRSLYFHGRWYTVHG